MKTNTNKKRLTLKIKKLNSNHLQKVKGGGENGGYAWRGNAPINNSNNSNN